jgi:hypothetical protein
MARLRPRLAFAVVSLLLGVGLHAQVAEAPRLFVGQEAAIEEFLRQAEVVKYQDISLGVTRPTRAWLAPGGLVTSIAWKPIRPGMYKGFYESYKSEIAAYEIDKLVELHMVPPTIERKLNGITGAVIMWLDNMRMWRDLSKEKPATPRWNAQMVRMKMFDVLIGNTDRNAGNILIDENWTVYLIDHSRAFSNLKEPRPSFGMIDRPLWTRMQALTEEQLQVAVGPWVEKRAIRAILERRNEMAKAIDKMVAQRGDRVYIHEN